MLNEQTAISSRYSISSISLLSSSFLYYSSFFLFLPLFLSFFTRVGLFIPERYHGTQIIPHPEEHSRFGDNSYSIVFDAGSTGTRIHIFLFNSIYDKRNKIRKIYLEKESFYYTNPGLSSYADDVAQAAKSLEPLMNKALIEVPEPKAKKTNVILKATAGLRLLPLQTADTILKSVKNYLISSPFKVNDDAVSMLDDRDEGIYAWYTVNFLLEKLHNISSSIVTLDLGGGSTQITFATADTQTLVRSPSGFIVKRDIEGEPEYLYTHSYLGLGLMSVRNEILLNSAINYENNSNLNVTTPCFVYAENTTQKWQFQDKTFFITGEKSPDSFNQCYELAQSIVSNSVHKAEELKGRDIYALSYFYDRLADVRVINVEENRGKVKVKDFYLTAENICKSVIRMKKQSPFLCLDLTYIVALLHDGYGLDWQKEITVIKKINGIETSWALGSAINLLSF